MRSLLVLLSLLSFQVSAAPAPSTTIDASWKIRDPKLANDLTNLYARQRKAAQAGDVKTFTSLEHSYRLKQMNNNMAKMKLTMNSDLLKSQAGAFGELKDPKFMKSSASTTIVIYEVREPDQLKPNDRSYTAVEFLKEGSAWKIGTESQFSYSPKPTLPPSMTLDPKFPVLVTAQQPEFEGGISYHAMSLSASIAVNGGTPTEVEEGQSGVGWIDNGFKKQNTAVITIAKGVSKPSTLGTKVEVEFLTRGKTEMKSLFKKTYTKPGVYKESFAVAL